MTNYGIKVGSNVDTDTDKQAKLTSKFSGLKLFKWVNAQFTTDGSGSGSVTVNHGLGYTPIAMVFQKFTAQYTFLSATSYPNAFKPVGYWNSYGDNEGHYFYADDTNITISAIGAIGFPGGGPAPNTTYYFRVLIFVDLSQTFSDQSNISLTGNYGFKVSKPGKNVLTDQEYNMGLSSKYKMLQLYEGHIQESTLSLPGMWATQHDTFEESATYVDFNHNLGYQPFFLFYTDIDDNYGVDSLSEGPYQAFSYVPIDTWKGIEEVSAWCDSSRVRIMFRRESTWLSGDAGAVYDSKTINIKCIIFAEDLTGSESS